MAHRDLKLLDAAQRAADLVNKLLDRPSGPRLLHTRQLRKSAQSTVANIAEGLGRRSPGDQARSFDIARGEAEESIEHLGANFRTRRLAPNEYWPPRNMFVVVVKMLDSFEENS